MIERVQSGELITASHINRIASAADTSFSGSGLLANRIRSGVNLSAINPLAGDVKGVVLQAVNDGASAVSVLDVVAISGRASVNEDMREVTISIDTFSVSNLDFMAVAIDDIPAGQMGRVVVSGVCYVRTDGGSGAYGAPESGSSVLAIRAGGLAQVLYNNTTGKIALIRFPVGGSGGDATHWQFVWNEGPDL